MKEAEPKAFDLRYEHFRLRNRLSEKEVLDLVRLNGIQEAVEVIEMDGKLVLLNGFKRYRAAIALNLPVIPWTGIGSSTKEGMLSLINQSNSKRLNVLEEAKFLVELTQEQKLSCLELSVLLKKSKGWISMRIRLFKDINKEIETLLFEGKFPVYAYMYSLRPFIRMNGVSKEEIRAFVVQMSGRDLSLRQIETLAEAWFKGSEEIKQQLQKGDLNWVLKRIQEHCRQDTGQCTEVEQRMLRMLEILLEKTKAFPPLSGNSKLNSNTYRCQAHYLMTAILSSHPSFIERMKTYHDQLGKTAIDLHAA